MFVEATQDSLASSCVNKPQIKLSIKSKIQISMIGVTACALFSYLMVAKDVFEKDKMATIYELNLKDSKFKAMSINSRILNLVSTGQSLIDAYDFRGKKNSKIGEQLFQRSTEVLALKMDRVDGDRRQNIILLEKKKDLFLAPDVLASIKLAILSREQLAVEFVRPDEGLFLISFKMLDPVQQGDFRAMLLVQQPDWTAALAGSGAQKFFLLNSQNQLVQAGSDRLQVSAELEQGLKDRNLLATPDQAFALSFNQRHYLLTSARFANLPMAFVSVADQEIAFAGFRPIYAKSFVFYVLTLGFVILVSVFVAKSMTLNLEKLKTATDVLSAGKFDVRLNIVSGDEVGVLAVAFQRMIDEIRRLLREIVEKTRMEGELKTARAVQETLFPPAQLRVGNVAIHGFYESASECGGDWWYHQTKGDEVFLVIADATGHGAPAALITSAARSAFSVIMEQEALSVSKLAWLLSRAIFDSSKGQILMTAFLLKINVKTGIVHYVNASHEPAMIVNSKAAQGVKLNPTFLMGSVSSRLGFGLEEEFTESQAQLKSGDFLVIYTDGLPFVQSATGVSFGERRLNQSLQKALSQQTHCEGVLRHLLSDVQRHRQGSALADDVAVAILEYRG